MPYGGPKCIIVPNFVQIGQGVAEIWPFSFFSRWRPSAISDFKKLEILTAHILLRFKMRHRTECVIVPNFVQIGQRVAGIWPFSIFLKMAAVRHLGFSKVCNFNCPHPSGGQNAPPRQILCRSVKALRDMAIFDFSRWRPSAILDFKKFKILTAHTLRRAKVHHCAKFCANRSNRCWDMAVFLFSRWRPSAILDFQKFVILTACTLLGAKMRHHAKFCSNQSRRCGDMAVFDFSRWRPSAILDLLYACLDHPRSVFCWSLSLCKIRFESVQ